MIEQKRLVFASSLPVSLWESDKQLESKEKNWRDGFGMVAHLAPAFSRYEKRSPFLPRDEEEQQQHAEHHSDPAMLQKLRERNL